MNKMTKDEILNMTMGRKTDLIIADKIMGFPKEIINNNGFKKDYDGSFVQVCPEYTSDIYAAWEIVEKSTSFELSQPQAYDDKTWFCSISFKNTHSFDGKAETAPLAICRAALLASIKNNE